MTPARPSLSPAWRRRLLYLSGGVLLGVFLVVQTTLILRTRGIEVNLPTLVGNLLNGLAWAVLAPMAVAAARRLPLVGPRAARHALMHTGLALAADASVGAIVLLATRPIDVGTATPLVLYVSNLLAAVPLYLLLWMGIVALVHAYDYAGRFRERERRAAELESQLARAQLDVLRSQLNPHFLFNTLNAVSTLMARDVRAARAVLADLSALLRLALDRMDAPETPLAEEIEFLDHYLDIERVRFHDRLRVDVDVAADTLDALVPPLLVQPLVENALKHAVAPRAGGGRIEITAHREASTGDGPTLVLTVTDDGPGLPPGGGRAGGLGLRHTRDRLATLYGPAASLALDPAPGGGLAATLRLPFRIHPTLPAPTPAFARPALALATP